MSEYLVVLSVIEGKQFPRRDKCNLDIEALFDGEAVQTDPTAHQNSPEFNTELTWLLDKKSLHMHRLQRSPVKVNCYMITENKQRQLMGYVIIDIRLALEDALPPKWHILLNSQYKKQKPELLLGLSLEKHDSNIFHKENVKSEPSIGSKKDNKLPSQLVLNEKDGVYEFGQSKDSEIFVISITIACAINILSLCQKDKNCNYDEGVFFYYSFLGNDITTDVICCKDDPEFPAERASIKIKSNQSNIIKLCHSFSDLQVYLCCGDITLGKADVPFNRLAIDSSDSFPKKVEGLFKIQNSKESPEISNEPAAVGLSILLQREKNSIQGSSKLGPKAVVQPKVNVKIDPLKAKNKASALDVQDNIKIIQLNDDVSEALNSKQNYRYCFTLDLRKITLQNASLKCSLRYSYPFFGTLEPISTHPTFEIQPNTPMTIPQGYCMFNFASTPKLLHDTLNSIPILVELYTHTTGLNIELIGTVNISLFAVLACKDNAIKNDNGLEGKRRIHTSTCQVLSSHAKTVIGELFTVMALDDFGPLNDSEIEKIKKNTEELSENAKVDSVNQNPTNDDESECSSHKAVSSSIPQKAALQIALELEAWKEQQQILFKNQLKEKEQKHMAALTTEWINRDKEREELLLQKVKSHEAAEKKLKDSLIAVEKRQKKLYSCEQEVSSLKSQLMIQKEALAKSRTDEIKKIREECKSNVSSEKRKIEELNHKLKLIVDEKDSLQQKLKLKEKEFDSFKSNFKLKPEIKLQNQLEVMGLEKAELERKLESATKSKVHYKQQWGRALKELSRIKQLQHEQAKQILKQQQEELEFLRLQQFNSNNNNNLSSEAKILQDINSEFNKLKGEILTDEVPQKGIVEEFRELQKNEAIKRLEIEKRILLQTGVYSNDDEIIQELNRNIQQAKDLAEKT